MIARKAGRLVSLGMLIGVISGCGSQLDPRLQVNNELRESCELKGKTLSDEQIRGILAETEEGRLRGITLQAAHDASQLRCAEQNPNNFDEFDCNFCRINCINQVYDLRLLQGS